jgi:hypothetical protein
LLHISQKVSALWWNSVRTALTFVPQRHRALLKKRGSRWESPSSSLMRATRRRLKIYMQSKTNKYIHAAAAARKYSCYIYYAVPPREECYRAPQFPISPLLARGGVWLKAFISVCNIFIMRERVCV